MSADQRLEELGHEVTAPFPIPEGVEIPLSFISVHGSRVMVAGHGPQNTDGSLAQPLGKVGQDLTLEQATEAARKTGLAMLGTIQRELGSLDRVESWVRVFGMVNATPDFTDHTPVINGFSQLMIDVFGESARCIRCAVGMSSLPLNIPVEIEAELQLRD